MITILSQPDSPLESFTHHIWSVTSNDPSVRQIEARFFKSGVLQFPAVRVQSSISGTAVFDIDIQEFLRDQMSWDLQNPGVAATAYTAPNSSYTYTAATFQELIDVNGKLEYAALQPSGVVSKTTINAARQTFNSPGLPDRIIANPAPTPNKFLTNSVRRMNIRSGESYQLSLYASTTATNAIAITWLNSSGAQVGFNRIDYTGTVGRYDICVGLANLATAGITPPAGATAYTVYVGNYSAPILTRHSEIITFNIETITCGTRIHFLNRWGGFDSITLAEPEKEITVRSTRYEKYLASGFTPRDRGRINQYREATPRIDASTGLISAAVAEWLEELASSPIVFWEKDGVMIPVTVDDGRFKTADNKPFEMEFSFTLSNDRRNQRL